MQKANVDLLIRLLGMTFFAYVIARYLIPVLYKSFKDFFKSHENSMKSDFDIDKFIKKKEVELSQNFGKAKSEDASNRLQKNRFPIIDLLKKKYPNLKDTHYLIELANELTWGEGNLIKKQKVNLENYLGVELDLKVINSNLVKIIEEVDFMKLIAKETSFNKYISFHLFMKVLFDYSNSTQFFEQIANKNKVSSTCLRKGFLHFIHIAANDEDISTSIDKIEKKMINEIGFSNVSALNIWFENKQAFSVVLKNIIKKASIFSFIEPLEEVKNYQQALTLLGCEAYDDEKEIKAKFKVVANKKHPDKLKAYHVPDQYINTATENFTKIQSAYELVLNKKRNNE